MKTNLKQQVALINAIAEEPSKVERVKLLRAFLNDYGYENIEDCKHYMLVRRTGRCSTCGVPVAEPVMMGSEEALQTLRETLARG